MKGTCALAVAAIFAVVPAFAQGGAGGGGMGSGGGYGGAADTASQSAPGGGAGPTAGPGRAAPGDRSGQRSGGQGYGMEQRTSPSPGHAESEGPMAAGPASGVVHQHLRAIAMNKLDGAEARYAPDATLEWIDRSGERTFQGAGNIRAAWQRFQSTHGPQEVRVYRVTQQETPAGIKVTADLKLTGQRPEMIRDELFVRDGRIAHELFEQVSVGGR